MDTYIYNTCTCLRYRRLYVIFNLIGQSSKARYCLGVFQSVSIHMELSSIFADQLIFYYGAARSMVGWALLYCYGNVYVNQHGFVSRDTVLGSWTCVVQLSISSNIVSMKCSYNYNILISDSNEYTTKRK